LPGYRTEAELDAEFENDVPQIVGGLLDLFVQTLQKLPDIHLMRPPRMADFTTLGEAMMQAQGKQPGEFQALYEENRLGSIARGIESSPVAVAVKTLAENYGRDPWTGNWKQLRIALDAYREWTDAWPKSDKGLSDAVRRQLPALVQMGIEVKIGKHGPSGVLVTIRNMTVRDGGDGHLEENTAGKKILGRAALHEFRKPHDGR